MSAPTTIPPTTSVAVFRFRLAACCALLVALALVQDAGLLAADTKFDLVAAPADWLARSLHLWDPEGGLGQVQNQAYGYLWPMGPFFLLGHLLDLPGWVVQRLWQGLVMSVAMVGAAKVSRAVGVRSDLACLVAGMAFALSPRLLTSLGPISIEVWPSALAPWVLLPLVHGALRGSPRRAAALSALAVAMVGGVNAAATLAVLPLGAIWLLTREPGRRRRSMMLWWPVFTALGTLWWLVPLAIMGRYSPPFLDFTETAAVTTFPTTLFDTLRGTSPWVPYGDVGWRAGNDFLRTSWIAVNSGVLLLLGLAGLADRRSPHRGFLGLSLLVGVLLVTLGHHGAVQGWFAGTLSEQLNGVLAPVRNLHKFDPVLRLPLVIGLGLVVDRALTARRERVTTRAERFPHLVIVVAVVVALVGTATPLLAGRVEQSGATLGVPGYWTRTAAYVDTHADGGATLLLPGSRFAEYVWGSPQDEPMQWLADSRWAVRNVVGQSQPGTIRMLDGIEQRFTEGRGSAGLTAFLRRAGISQLVVRNDLQRSDDVPDPVLVHQTLAQSPGIERVASFGPAVGAQAAHLGVGDDRVVVADGRQASYPAVEVYAVSAASAPTVSADAPTVVVGGPEDLPDLLDALPLGTAPVELAADADRAGEGPRPRRVVLTDGLRAREQSFARIHDGSSAVLTPGDVRRTTNRVRDYLVDDADRWSTRARLDGARALSASSSASDSDAAGGSRRGDLPYAAVDGAPDTAWQSAFAPDERAWWQIDLERPLDVRALEVTTPTGEGSQLVRVRTAVGVSPPVRISAGGTRRIALPVPGNGSPEVSWVRVEDGSDVVGRQLELAEVAIPGVAVRRVLDLPSLPTAWEDPDAVVMHADRDARTGCVVVGPHTRCAAGEARASEDGAVVRRSFDLSTPATYGVAVAARPRSGADLDRLVLADQPANAVATSLGVPDPRAGAVAAIDGDPSTAWIAAPEGADSDSGRVDLRLSWLSPEPVTTIDLDLDDDTAATLPDRVRLRFFRAGTREVRRDVTLDARGRGSFPRVLADGVRIRVLSAPPIESLGFDGVAQDLPVGIGEIRLGAVPYLPLSLPTTPVLRACGTGPTVQVGPRSLRTALVASAADLAAGREVPARVCGTGTDSADAGARVDLPAGTVDVVATRSAQADATRVVLTSTDDPGPTAAPYDAGGTLGGPVHRGLSPAPGTRVVALRENASPGWVAHQGDRTLTPVTLDGWQQGFVLRDDTRVAVTFAPDRAYRLGLLGGGLAALALLFVLLVTRRRWLGPAHEPVGERAPRATVAVTLSLLGAGLVAGWVGIVLAVVVLAVQLALRRWASEAEAWLLAGPVLVAAFVYAAMPWGGDLGWAGDVTWVGYLSVVPLVAVVASAARPRPEVARSTSRFRRMPGSSTTR